jgi:sialate O-acetylesterase
MLKKLLFTAVIGFMSTQLYAKIQLPSVFSDHMVIQQQIAAAFWGTATPGKKVVVIPSWDNKKYSAVADAAGNWKLKINTPTFGGPYQLSFDDGEGTLVLKDVLLGDVWICSGQSNMEMPLAGWGKIVNYQTEIAQANFPSIRLLTVEKATSNIPLKEAKIANGGWQQCSPASVGEFSSTAYFFAREVYRQTKIPIGLIHTSWGGTIAEAWTSADALRKMSDFVPAVDRLEQQANSEQPNENSLPKWLKQLDEKDLGNKSGKFDWATATVATDSWKEMNLPSLWEQRGLKDFDGVVWFTKKVVLPKEIDGKSITLNLGTIDDNESTWFNGVKVGETNNYSQKRTYVIPASAVKAGENLITVRVVDTGGEGGFYGEAEDMNISLPTGEKIKLAGNWKFQIGLDLKNVDPMPQSDNGPNRVTVLYNAMIHPLLQYAIKGAIWYQGESNAGRPQQYETLFPLMINNWRSKWQQGNFPFYFVQLAGYMKDQPEPADYQWAELRAAQAKTLALPNTGMAVTIDIGDEKDIHPKNKQEVGRRLALVALSKTYGKAIAYAGPVYQSYRVLGNKIEVSFASRAGNLALKKGGINTGFAIAGADKKFYWANAVVSGNKVMVSSPQVKAPVAVRYDWGNSPVVSLTDGSQLPAYPFKTDK